MPTQRIIKSTFIGLNNEPLRNAVVQVIHMKGNTINNVEYPQVTKNFITNREGKINFILWCNEEGERSSFYRFVLPGGETFDAIVPVGTSDLELSVLREGGGDSSDPQHQSLITYILSQAGVSIATNTMAGKVRTNTNSTDPVVYLKSEVDNLIASVSGADLTNYYTKPQADSLLITKADKSTTYTKTQTDALIGGVTVDLSSYYTKTQTDALVTPKANSSDVTAALSLKANSSDVTTSLAAKANQSTTYTKTEVDGLINPKANSNDVYTKTQTDTLISGAIPSTAKGTALGVATLDSGGKIPDTQISDAITRDTELTVGLATKADSSTTYTKTQTDTLLTTKANQSTTYTKTEVDTLVAASDTLVELIDVAISSPSNTQVLAYNSSTSKWTNQTISTGETNTASNVGVGGVGVFKQKTGANLEFKNINAGSSKISITNDTANSEIDIDVNESNLTLGNLSGTLAITKGGTGSTSASAALTALGAASTTSLTSHTIDTSNPHSTTAAQVGNTTAQWNASKIQGVDVISTAPTNGQILTYNSTTSKWTPTTSSGGGSSTLATLTDATITSPTESQILTYNATTSKWENKVASNSHPGYKSGLCYLHTDKIATANSTGFTTGTIRYSIFYVAYPIVISNFIINVITAATAGTTAFGGIYSHNLSTIAPDTLLGSNSVAVDTVGTKSFTMSLSLKPGNYWFASSFGASTTISSTGSTSSFIGSNYNFGVSSGSLPLGNNSYGYSNSYTHAALPSTATTTALINLSISPLYWFTIA
ncbi:hypothetical protein GTQ43_30515 [Nostoc sp. KVJ3]|uniref:hypothetical protein n=1 Tax=Nostoc sp. KVJ3 TaxID=457945 RepID=UPI002237B13F|nr:hypothetical protein [Nostoc sp. KVJ3]MCW5317947.1 hypothetical protein [Nostoc sp. KVJ3]